MSRRALPRPITVTVDDACAMTGLGRTHLYELIATGEVRSVKSGRRRLILVESLDTYIERLAAATKQAA